MTTHTDQPGGLSPDDQRLLDALVEGGFDAEALEGLSPSDQRRADTLTGLFELLEDYPVEDADDTLVHATLARIDRAEDDRAARLAFENVALDAERTGRGRRLPDFISIAAVILIGASVVWPVMSYIRQRSVDSGCNNNLRQMAWAFNQYSEDYNGAMPIARAGLFSSWSPTNHNVVNLKPLIDNGYCERGHLTCPGHDGLPGESYSYQWQVPGHLPHWGTGRVTLVLGDRNPIIDAVRSGRSIPPLTVSINHGGRGQWVLGSDAQTVWLVQPVVGGNDNIWLPARAPILKANQPVDDPTDVFLAH